MTRHTLKFLGHLQQDFKSVFDHFGTLCIKGLKHQQILPKIFTISSCRSSPRNLFHKQFNFLGFFLYIRNTYFKELLRVFVILLFKEFTLCFFKKRSHWFFLLVNLDVSVTWIWFSVAVQRKLGQPHFQTELNPLTEML